MKLIDKDAVVAEIKRRISTYKHHYEELARYEVWNDAKKIEPKINELENLLSFINTIEVKDTDAFIDKACDWLKENKDKYLYNTGGKGEYIPTCSGKMIDEFRNYIEGE